MTSEKKEELQRQCSKFRNDLIDLLYSIQTGHPGGSLSYTGILTSFHFEIMNVNPEDPEMEGRSHLIPSKGHAAPMLYLVLAEKGFFPKEELRTLRQMDSMLRGHPCAHKTPGVELSTGPLGLGLSTGLGMVMVDRIKGLDSYIYVVMGDGEIEEGCVWEAAISASKFEADHLVGILDNNGVQLNGTLEEIMPMGDTRAKWKAFGWDVIPCDSHDVEDFCRAVEETKKTKGCPSLILAATMKGKGVSFMEGKNTRHGKAINDNEYAQAKAELGGIRQWERIQQSVTPTAQRLRS